MYLNKYMGAFYYGIYIPKNEKHPHMVIDSHAWVPKTKLI